MTKNKDKSTRKKRPEPNRSDPIRSFAALLGTPGSENRADRENQTAAPAAGESISEVFSKSVDLGYQVIDEYVRQGQRAAERLSRGQSDAPSSIGDLQDVARKLARSGAELMEAWMLLASGTAGNLDTPSDSGAPSATSPDSGRSQADETRVRLVVQSDRPTGVELDIRAEPGVSNFRVDTLRPMDPGSPAIESVRFEPGEDTDPGQIVVLVPPGHPPGRYHALVLDEVANRPVGTLTVHIEPGPPESSAH